MYLFGRPAPPFNFWVCPIWAAASQKINVPCGGKFKRGNQRWPLESLKLHNTQVFTPVPDKQNGYFYSIRKNQKKGTAIWTMIDRCFFCTGLGLTSENLLCKLYEIYNFWIMEGKHQKHNVVWTAPFWIIVDTFTASHGKNVNRSPTYLFKWLVTCGKLWSSHFCFLIFFLRIKNRKIITKNQHQKQHVVWTAPFWIIVGTFTASHGKNVNRSPTYLFKWLVTCGKLWSSHFCFLIFFLRIKNRKIITKIKMVKGGKGLIER